MIRAFLAIRPTLDVIQGLLSAQAELDGAGADVRWVSAEAVHLTIQFLGDVRESEIPQIESGLREQLGALAPFEIECRGLGTFPNQKRPRVVWVGLRGDGIHQVADAAETVLSPLGFPPEERDLTPHITTKSAAFRRRGVHSTSCDSTAGRLKRSVSFLGGSLGALSAATRSPYNRFRNVVPSGRVEWRNT
jgi:2'-5' RNA ligase